MEDFRLLRRTNSGSLLRDQLQSFSEKVLLDIERLFRACFCMPYSLMFITSSAKYPSNRD